MVKDMTPFPDQDQIRMDIARVKYRSKIDLLNAYEQVRVEPEDVKKTAFSTVFSTFLSQVMQQGDCNTVELVGLLCTQPCSVRDSTGRPYPLLSPTTIPRPIALFAGWSHYLQVGRTIIGLVAV